MTGKNAKLMKKGAVNQSGDSSGIDPRRLRRQRRAKWILTVLILLLFVALGVAGSILYNNHPDYIDSTRPDLLEQAFSLGE